MSLKCGIVGYVPPNGICNAAVFQANVRQYKTSVPLYLYSDYPWPDTIKTFSPEMLKHGSNKFGVNNMTWMIGLQLAIRQKLDYFLYLEADCRVMGDEWDKRVWDELFSFQRMPLVAGTLAVYNPFNAGPEAAKCFCELVAKYNTKRNYPITGYMPVRSYGWKGAADSTGACVFPNGALGVYSVDEMKALFGACNMASMASSMTAWDMEIGKRLWARHGVNIFKLAGVLTSIYSGYGNVLNTEKERIEMLTSGAIAAVHQVKSEWKPE